MDVKRYSLVDRQNQSMNFADSVGKISDGYHTFNELYAHRIELYIQLCRVMRRYRSFPENKDCGVWRSQKHSDGSGIDGWFVMGIFERKGLQITYHLPIERWEECDFAETLETAPEFDGHTSGDVLSRLRNLHDTY